MYWAGAGVAVSPAGDRLEKVPGLEPLSCICCFVRLWLNCTKPTVMLFIQDCFLPTSGYYFQTSGFQASHFSSDRRIYTCVTRYIIIVHILIYIVGYAS